MKQRRLFTAVCVAAVFSGLLAAQSEEFADVDKLGVFDEARRLRREAQQLRRMAEKLDRELEEMEEVALKLRQRVEIIENAGTRGDSAHSEETRRAIADARLTARELVEKARDLSVKIREMEEHADRSEEKADRLECTTQQDIDTN
jgi:methyl-accepting chemotaxis protein